jgi:hypothetical protein
MGKAALSNNTTGADNSAYGKDALVSNTTGATNVAVGATALFANTTGSQNVGIGENAGFNITTGSNNVCIGRDSTAASATTSNSVTLGGVSISSLRCAVQTISSLSDARDKTDVIDLPESLDFINKLRPVKFKWNPRDNNGKDGLYEHGFIAQDLQAVQKENNADYLNMVLDDNPDRLEASYGKLVPILVNAIKELSVKVTALEAG